MGKISNIKPYAKNASDIFLTLLFVISMLYIQHIPEYSSDSRVLHGSSASAVSLLP